MEMNDDRECPICLDKLIFKDQVLGLMCSKLHLYHKYCLENMV
jgi:hypothetical protein